MSKLDGWLQLNVFSTRTVGGTFTNRDGMFIYLFIFIIIIIIILFFFFKDDWIQVMAVLIIFSGYKLVFFMMVFVI